MNSKLAEGKTETNHIYPVNPQKAQAGIARLSGNLNTREIQ